MTISETSSGDLIDVTPLGEAIATTKTTKVFQSANVDVIRMVLTAGKEIAEHTATGDITVQCIEGLIDFTIAGNTVQLRPGNMLCLTGHEPHALHALQDSSLLLTLLRTPRSD